MNTSTPNTMLEPDSGPASRDARRVLADCVGPHTKVRQALLADALVGHPGAVSVWQALDAMEKYAALRQDQSIRTAMGEGFSLSPQPKPRGFHDA